MEKFGLDSRIVVRRSNCGGKCCLGKKPMGHGPYGYSGPGAQLYVGGDEKVRELELARDVVRAELAALETPEVKRVRELQERARGGVHRSQGLVAVPIVGAVGPK